MQKYKQIKNSALLNFLKNNDICTIRDQRKCNISFNVQYNSKKMRTKKVTAIHKSICSIG
jgi:hypothetical protein